MRAKGMTSLKGVWSKRLRTAAAEMAEKDSLKIEVPGPAGEDYSGSAGSYARTFTYTTYDPRDLPKELREMPRDPKIKTIAVGACFSGSKSYAGGVFWVVVQLY